MYVTSQHFFPQGMTTNARQISRNLRVRGLVCSICGIKLFGKKIQLFPKPHIKGSGYFNLEKLVSLEIGNAKKFGIPRFFFNPAQDCKYIRPYDSDKTLEMRLLSQEPHFSDFCILMILIQLNKFKTAQYFFLFKPKLDMRLFVDF